MNKSKIKKLVVILIVLTILLWIIFGLWKSYQPQNSQIQGSVQADVIHVTTKLISRISEIYVKTGQPVKKGQVLALLYSPEIDAKKQQAYASLQSALALQASTYRGSREENTATLYANWQSVRAQQELAQTTYQRGNHLYQQGVISRQRRDELFAAKQSATQLTEASYQQYKRAQDGSTREQKTIADSQVEIARAAVNEIHALEAETKLIAPIDGIVADVYGNPSELIATGVPVVSLIDEQHLWVSLNIREDQYAAIQHISSLSGYIPALKKDMFFKISYIEPQGDFATIKNTRQTGGYDIRSFKLHLVPQNQEPALREGMSVLFQFNEIKN